MSELEVRTSFVQNDITIDRLLRVLSRRWWWLTVAIVAGAFSGLLFSLMLPATYQATASLGIGIDYGRTHSLNRETERQALLRVQDLLLSDDVLMAALEAAGPGLRQELDLSRPDQFRELIRVDRFEGRWDLSVFSRQPAESARLANSWSQASIQALESAVEAAWRARDLQTRVYDLGCHLKLDEEAEQAVLDCQRGSAEEAQDLHSTLLLASEESRGILPALSYAELREAGIPTKSVNRSRSWLVLGGLLVGMAVGMTVLLIVPTRARGDVSVSAQSSRRGVAPESENG